MEPFTARDKNLWEVLSTFLSFVKWTRASEGDPLDGTMIMKVTWACFESEKLHVHSNFCHSFKKKKTKPTSIFYKLKSLLFKTSGQNWNLPVFLNHLLKNACPWFLICPRCTRSHSCMIFLTSTLSSISPVSPFPSNVTLHFSADSFPAYAIRTHSATL